MTSFLGIINSHLIKCGDYEIRAHFSQQRTSFLEVENRIILEMKKKINDTISCPSRVEETVENFLPTLPVNTISEIYYHTLLLSLAWVQQEDCHFLLKEPEICDKFITHCLIFFPTEIFYSVCFSIVWLWGEMCSKMAAVWQVYHYS